jgi:hypothetical protein
MNESIVGNHRRSMHHDGHAQQTYPTASPITNSGDRVEASFTIAGCRSPAVRPTSRDTVLA